MEGRLIVPIKAILTGRANIRQLEEFEFIRNNPMVSTIGAAALGGATVHDYHKNGYQSVGKYIGDKIDTVKNAVSDGADKTRETINNATKPSDSDHVDVSTSHTLADV